MERPWWVTNEEDWLHACRGVVSTAERILDGSLGITEGARLLNGLRHQVRAWDDKDFLVFTAIVSETDAFPLGDVRQYWNADALAREDAKREVVEAEAKPLAEPAAKALIRKYE